MASKKQDVAKREEAPPPAELWAETADTGFEETSSDDYAVPFVKVLQTNSPEVDENDSAYVEGAKPGKFFNTATREVYDSIDVVPCYYRHAMVEWRPRTEGGGFVAQHEVGAEKGLQRDDSGKFLTEDGTYLADTRYYFSLLAGKNGEALALEAMSPIVVPFASTQIKKSRNWLSQMRDLKATGKDGQPFVLPMFSHVYRFTTVPESNDKGKWHGYAITRVGPITDPRVVKAAIDARELFKGAAASVKPPADVDGGDDNIPF